MKLAIALCAVLAAAPLAAQTPAEIRTAQTAMMNLERRMMLAMVDSMPMQYWRDKATPMQRDFAQQIHHTASAIPMILNRVAGAPRATLPTDAYVNAVFDYAVGVLRDQTDADRAGVVNLFGTRVTRWQLWDELHQHSMWTLGQIVANFRKNNMAPPPFGFF
jgi:hypothetical protein